MRLTNYSEGQSVSRPRDITMGLEAVMPVTVPVARTV
jgi:hypothetical protein